MVYLNKPNSGFFTFTDSKLIVIAGG